MNIQELFGATQAAYDHLKDREEAKDAASEAYSAAKQEYDAALNVLNDYRAQLNDILGNVASDPRFRKSA